MSEASWRDNPLGIDDSHLILSALKEKCQPRRTSAADFSAFQSIEKQVFRARRQASAESQYQAAM
jgi:hypothetical protein